MTNSGVLPPGVRVFERGWLSANNILLTGDGPVTLIDSGYATHSPQTLELVHQALGARPIDVLVNTHLHSDHCGGNAALQARYAELETWVPPGHARAVKHWDAHALTYVPTGQVCPQFRADKVLIPGSSMRLGRFDWEIHAAPGHDPHSVVLFEPQSRTLISADALWESGFGVVFPELEGLDAFGEVERTLDLIESLDPLVVIPGHGAIFCGVNLALATARSRLEGFMSAPAKHARHAAKVLLKFKLLEVQVFSNKSLHDWARSTSYLDMVRLRWEPEVALAAWIELLIDDLVRVGAARREGTLVVNA